MSGTLHAGLISTNPEKSWQKTCRSLPPLGSVERPWKFIFRPSSVLTAPLPIKCKPHNAVREVRIIAPATEKQAKVVKDFVTLKTKAQENQPVSVYWGAVNRCHQILPMLSPWEDRLHVWRVTTVILSFLKGRQEHEVTKCLGKHLLLIPPNTDCFVGYPYQLTGLIFPFAYKTSAFVHDRCTYCLYHIAESYLNHWIHCSKLMYLNSTIDCNDQSGKKEPHTQNMSSFLSEVQPLIPLYPWQKPPVSARVSVRTYYLQKGLSSTGQ